jgi:hypothetical protein
VGTDHSSIVGGIGEKSGVPAADYSSRSADHAVGVVTAAAGRRGDRYGGHLSDSARPGTHQGMFINWPVSPLSLLSHPLAAWLIPGRTYTCGRRHFISYRSLVVPWGGGGAGGRRACVTAEQSLCRAAPRCQAVPKWLLQQRDRDCPRSLPQMTERLRFLSRLPLLASFTCSRVSCPSLICSLATPSPPTPHPPPPPYPHRNSFFFFVSIEDQLVFCSRDLFRSPFCVFSCQHCCSCYNCNLHVTEARWQSKPQAWVCPLVFDKDRIIPCPIPIGHLTGPKLTITPLAFGCSHQYWLPHKLEKDLGLSIKAENYTSI